MYARAITPEYATTWGGWYPSLQMRRGMGASGEQIVGTVSSLGTPILTGALASSAAASAAAGGSGLILGMTAAQAVPIIGAAIVGVTIAVIELIKLSKGCGQTCIVTSEWANQAEDLLKKNLAAYMALPTPRPRSAQNTALSNFNVVWAQLQQLCGQPGTQDAGVRCITDRQRGACKWRDASGQCWNWFTGYYDPIANDQNVVDDSISAQASGIFANVASGGDLLVPALAIAGIILAVNFL